MPGTVSRIRAAAAVGVLACAGLTACGGGAGNDNPTFRGPLPVTSSSVAPKYPPVPVNVLSLQNVEYPQVAKVPTAGKINAALLRDAKRLLSRKVACNVSALRADTAVLSFRWTCAGEGGITASFGTRGGRALTLADVFRPGYLQTLSTTAVTQLVAGGASTEAAERAAPPRASAFSQWAMDDQSLQVTFTVGSTPVTISFPLASLSSLILPTGPLGP